MRTFIENYLHFIKNCIRPPYKKLKSLKSRFIENSNFEDNRDPCPTFHFNLFGHCRERTSIFSTENVYSLSKNHFLLCSFFKFVSGPVVEWLLCPKKRSFFTENVLFICPENVGKYFCWKKILCFVRIRALIDYWQIDELLLGKCSPCHLLCSFIVYYKCTPFVIA